MRTALLVMAIVAVTAPGIRAQDVISSDRPGIGSGATVLGPGTFQLEAGLDLAHARRDDLYTFSVGQALVRIGARGFELEVFLNSFQVSGIRGADGPPTGEGFQDLGIGVKVPLLAGSGGRFSLSAQGILSAPTGSDLFTNDEWVPTWNLLADLGVTEALAVSFNAGYQAGPGDVEDGFTLFVTPGAALDNGVGIYWGWAGFFNEGGDTHIAEGGLTFLKGNDVQLDLNGGWDVDARDYFVGVGVAVRR